jgi:hypothetical protein
MPSQNGDNRLDRIERALELLIDDHVQFREEHKMLLTAQVLLTDTMAKLAQAQRATDEQLRTTDGRLNALISVVDGIIRNRPT